jgi:hypothetical protein
MLHELAHTVVKSNDHLVRDFYETVGRLGSHSASRRSRSVPTSRAPGERSTETSVMSSSHALGQALPLPDGRWVRRPESATRSLSRFTSNFAESGDQVSLIAQRMHGIDLCCATRWEIAGSQSNNGEKNGYG